jgi:hypothetical protein
MLAAAALGALAFAAGCGSNEPSSAPPAALGGAADPTATPTAQPDPGDKGVGQGSDQGGSQGGGSQGGGSQGGGSQGGGSQGGGGGNPPASSWPTPEDCVSYNPANVTVAYDYGIYTVSSGGTVVITGAARPA